MSAVDRNLMRDLDLCLSLGSGAETVNLCRTSRNLTIRESHTLESDCWGRYLGKTVLPRTDGSQGYLYGLAHCGGHVLPSVRPIEVQHMLLNTGRGSRLLSVSIFAGNPSYT